MNIVVLKLLTSEEIITELVSQDDEKITICNPVYLVVNQQTGNGSFQPFIMASNLHEGDNKKVSILRDKLLIPMLEASKQTAEQYQQVFSQIVTPPVAIIQ